MPWHIIWQFQAIFWTSAYAKRLRATGVSEDQTEAHAEALVAVEGQIATKADIRDMATKANLAELRAAIKTDIAELRTDLLRWMIGLAIAQCALLVSIVILRQ